jgi:hypothetical protein
MANFSPEFLKIMGFDSGLGEDDDRLTTRLDSSHPENDLKDGKEVKNSVLQVSGLRKNDSKRNILTCRTNQTLTEPKRFHEKHQTEDRENVTTPNLQPRGSVQILAKWGTNDARSTQPSENDVTAFISKLLKSSHLSPSSDRGSSDRGPIRTKHSESDQSPPSKQIESTPASSDKIWTDLEGDQPDKGSQDSTRQDVHVFDTYKSPSSNTQPLHVSRLGRREGATQQLLDMICFDNLSDGLDLHRATEGSHPRGEREIPLSSELSLARPSLSRKQEFHGSPSHLLCIEQKGREETFQRLLIAPQFAKAILDEGQGTHDLEPSVPEALCSPTIVTARPEDHVELRDRSEPEESCDVDNSLFTQLGCSDDSSGSAKHSKKKKRNDIIRIRDLQMKSYIGEAVHTSLWFGTNSQQTPHISCEIILSRFDAMPNDNETPPTDPSEETPFRVATGNKKEKVKNISEFVVTFQPSACGLYSAVLQFQSRRKVWRISSSLSHVSSYR